MANKVGSNAPLFVGDAARANTFGNCSSPASEAREESVNGLLNVIFFFKKIYMNIKLKVWTNNTNTTIISFYLDAPNISRRTLLSLVAENGEDVAKNERANENDFSRAKTSLSRRSSIDRQRAKVNCFELFFCFKIKIIN